MINNESSIGYYWDREAEIDNTDSYEMFFVDDSVSWSQQMDIDATRGREYEIEKPTYFLKTFTHNTAMGSRAASIYATHNIDAPLDFWQARRIGKDSKRAVEYHDRMARFTTEERRQYQFFRAQYFKFSLAVKNRKVSVPLPIGRRDLENFEKKKAFSLTKDCGGEQGIEELTRTEGYILYINQNFKVFQKKIDNNNKGNVYESTVIPHHEPRQIFRHEGKNIYSHSILLKDDTGHYYTYDCSAALRRNFFEKMQCEFGQLKNIYGIQIYENGWLATTSGISRGFKNIAGYYITYSPILKRAISVHRLVCTGWNIKKDPKHTDVNHKDGNKENNHFDNLEWCTKSENTIHAWKTGLMKNYSLKLPYDPHFTIQEYRKMNKTEFL